MHEPTAEIAYLFRHALLRDAAYELQLPADRASMHTLAYELIEEAFGGPAPAMPAMSKESMAPHATDAVASELARHAELALEAGLPVRSQALRSHRQAALYAERQLQFVAALAHWQRLEALCDPADRGWVLLRMARQQYFTGDQPGAERSLEAALQVARAAGDTALQARALSTLGSVLRQTTRGDETGQLYEQALELQREVGDARLIAGDIGNLGIFYDSIGLTDKAEALFLEALQISRVSGDVPQQARLLGYLGDHYRDRGRMDDSLHYLQAAMRVEGNTDRAELALQVERLGVWHAISGNMLEAESELAKAIAMYREMGNQRSLGMALGNMGNVCYDTGRLDESEQMLKHALSIHRELGNVSFVPNTLASLGSVAIERGDLPAAIAYHEEAMACLEHSRSVAVKGGVTLGYGLCLALLGQRDEAQTLWRRGVAILEQAGCAPELEMRSKAMRAVCAKAGIPLLDESSS